MTEQPKGNFRWLDEFSASFTGALAGVAVGSFIGTLLALALIKLVKVLINAE